MKKKIEQYIVMAAAATGAVASVIGFYSEINPEPPGDMQVQIERLNRAGNDLKELEAFFEAQQRKILRSQELLKTLELEQANLQPVVEANRAIVEAVLNAQAASEKRDRWTERLIGFLFGIAGSLIASVIWSRFQRSRENI